MGVKVSTLFIFVFFLYSKQASSAKGSKIALYGILFLFDNNTAIFIYIDKKMNR